MIISYRDIANQIIIFHKVIRPGGDRNTAGSDFVYRNLLVVGHHSCVILASLWRHESLIVVTKECQALCVARTTMNVSR